MAGPVESSDDRRDDPRGPIELKVEYKRLNAFFADYARNISKGGTFIATEKPLPIGTEFVFKLFIKSLDRPLELHGAVQWISAGTPDQEAGMGIRFLYENPRQREAMERIVEKLMVDSLGQLLYTKLMQHSREGDGGGREPGADADTRDADATSGADAPGEEDSDG